jgi:putative ABC transport system permease protein
MRSINIVLKELFERKSRLITAFIIIVLGIGVIVGIETITQSSEKAVARELDQLGANVLILPKSATVSDYYTADFKGEELPEDYVDMITTSDLKGVDNLSPKLTFPVTVADEDIYLTGILPKNEFAVKPLWQTAGTIFDMPEGCGTVPSPVTDGVTDTGSRTIDSLAPSEVLVGSEVASRLNLSTGSELAIKEQKFTVTAVLPQTGTVDDGRVFAHLHTVQALFGKGPVVNVIEMVGCCDEISKGLITNLNELLPGAKVVTIEQIVTTQQKTNDMMGKFSLISIIIAALVGGISIANYMFANIYERRKEIGALLAIGATPGKISSIFLMKSLILGLAGGIVGYLVGTLLAVTLGPQIAGTPVLPVPSLFGFSILISIAITTASSLIPARRAAQMDPADTLREI